jgi:hypothetical protein
MNDRVNDDEAGLPGKVHFGLHGIYFVNREELAFIEKHGADEFEARCLGVPVERFIRWKRLWELSHTDEGLRCHGVTTKGKPCRNELYFWKIPLDFDEYDLYCHLHKDQASRVQE